MIGRRVATSCTRPKPARLSIAVNSAHVRGRPLPMANR